MPVSLCKSRVMERYHFVVFLLNFSSIGTQDDVIEIIKSEGYLAELHSVTTDDAYILNIHRIRAPEPTSKIVLFMHGLQINSFAYVFSGSEHSLAFQLSNHGYDVWIGNARGTEFSRRHQTLDASHSTQFWDFSFHEIAKYDLPAIIDRILTITNRSALHYIGNSQATTSVLALLALQPEYNKKIFTLHLMTPVVFVRHVSPWFKNFGPLIDIVEGTFDAMDISREIFIVDDDTRSSLANMCNVKSKFTYNVCQNYYFLIAGRSSEQWNDKLFVNTTKLFQHIPNSISLRQILHYFQLYSKGKFLQYDFKLRKNLLLYNQSDPPEYNLTNVRTKIHILYGTTDNVANSKDVEELIKFFRPLIIGVDKMVGWNHGDFLIAKNMGLITKNILKLMKQYSKID